MKLKFILYNIILFSFGLTQNEFSEGPYGNNYFDIAGPFTIPDLNSSLDGDINSDDIVNIQDIILVIGAILGTIFLDDQELEIAIKKVRASGSESEVAKLEAQLSKLQAIGGRSW